MFSGPLRMLSPSPSSFVSWFTRCLEFRFRFVHTWFVFSLVCVSFFYGSFSPHVLLGHCFSRCMVNVCSSCCCFWDASWFVFIYLPERLICHFVRSDCFPLLYVQHLGLETTFNHLGCKRLTVNGSVDEQVPTNCVHVCHWTEPRGSNHWCFVGHFGSEDQAGVSGVTQNCLMKPSGVSVSGAERSGLRLSTDDLNATICE